MLGAPLQRGRRLHPSPLLIVAAVLATTWLCSGVPIGDILLFCGYELAYVLLPGCLLYLLLCASPGSLLRTVAIGWPLGYALELGAYALAAALHVRGAFALLPLLALAAMGPIALRRYGVRRSRDALAGCLRLLGSRGARGENTAPPPRSHLLVLAGAMSAALMLLALSFFASYPLPGSARSVVYYVDNVWDISLAAEARHHWPITEPYVAGHAPMHYYYGVFIHVAAVNQVTGVALSTVILRLLPATALIVMALQLWLLASALGGSRWTGPLAVILGLVAQDLNVDPTRPLAFGADLFNTLPLSPTFAFGAPLFLALLALVQSHLASEDAAAARAVAGSLAMVSILVLALSIVKSVAVVDFIGGLALFGLWRAVEPARSVGRFLPRCLVASSVCLAVVYVLVLSGGLGSSLRISPFAFVEYTNFAPILNVHSVLRIVPLAGAGLLACLLTCAPLLGAAWLFRGKAAIPSFVLFSVAVFAVSLSAYIVLSAHGDSQGYFLAFGYIAMLPIAAEGLVRLWGHTPADARRRLLRAGCALLALGLGLAASTQLLSGGKGLVWDVWYLAAYGLLAAAVALGALRLERGLTRASSSRALRVLACCILMLGTLALVKPLSTAASRTWKTLSHTRISTADSPENQGMTTPLYGGLLWVRAHTTPCDVLAVNNHLDRARYLIPKEGEANLLSRYFYYSAFTERRVYLESWYSTPAGVAGGQPFPARLALNDLATLHGDASALRELKHLGVSYVLIDRTHGGGAPEPAGASRLVFENSALAVYRLVGGPSPAEADGACNTAS
jgi:hypothetical protein